MSILNLIRFRYDKTENLKLEDLLGYTHLLVEAKDWDLLHNRYAKAYHVLDVVTCFARVNYSYKTFPPFEILTRPCIYVVERLQNIADSELNNPL